jgi:predicted nucleic acid-binding protein
MSARTFLDSNILVYTDDQSAPEKQAAALDLVELCFRDRRGVLSTQVLQEYFSAATKKLKVPAELAKRKIQVFSRFNLVLVGLDDILGAIDLHRLDGFSIWDALIIRAALRSGCSFLYSEDLQAGRKVNGLEIINPFR